MGKNKIDQDDSYKYLGILFHVALNWREHEKYAKAKAKQNAGALTQFFFMKGRKFLPAATRVIKTKTVTQVLYRAPIWFPHSKSSCEGIQCLFLRLIFGVPR